MSLFGRKPLTAEEALDQVRAVSGQSCTLMVTTNAHAAATSQERAEAREALAAHLRCEPKRRREVDYPLDITLGEFRRIYQAEYETWAAWSDKREAFKRVGHALTYSIQVGSYEFASHMFGEEACSIEEALSRALDRVKSRGVR